MKHIFRFKRSLETICAKLLGVLYNKQYSYDINANAFDFETNKSYIFDVRK